MNISILKTLRNKYHIFYSLGDTIKLIKKDYSEIIYFDFSDSLSKNNAYRHIYDICLNKWYYPKFFRTEFIHSLEDKQNKRDIKKRYLESEKANTKIIEARRYINNN